MSTRGWCKCSGLQIHMPGHAPLPRNPARLTGRGRSTISLRGPEEDEEETEEEEDAEACDPDRASASEREAPARSPLELVGLLLLLLPLLLEARECVVPWLAASR